MADGSRPRARGLGGTLPVGAAVVGAAILAGRALGHAVRAVAPTLTGLPGGGWTAGVLLGPLTLAGWAGADRFTGRERPRTAHTVGLRYLGRRRGQGDSGR